MFPLRNRMNISPFFSIPRRCAIFSCFVLTTAFFSSTIDAVKAQSTSSSNSGVIGIDLNGDGIVDVPTGVTIETPELFTPIEGTTIETNTQPTPKPPGLVTTFPPSR
ncbi:MAG: hypothetical protein AB4372_23830, partial [Xenococcus sp. (in: cyanobacteria)]